MGSTSFLRVSIKHDLPVALIAGGAGFLGSTLCRFLLRKKVQVICVDNFRTGDQENIADFLGDKNFFLLEHNLTKSLPKISNIDYVFHLAGLEDYLDGKDLNLETLEVNSSGTQNLLELARQNQAKFLFTSALEVFSQFPLLSTKVVEGIAEQQKLFSHQEAKRFSESLIAEYFRRYNLNCRIVRLADIYGPGMNLDAGTALASFFKSAKEGKQLTVRGEGLEILYPTYMEDAAEGIIRAMFLSHTAGKIYNLAGAKTTVLKIAQTLRRAMGEKTEIEFEKSVGEELKLSLPPDFEKTQEELGWRTSVSLEEGIKRTLDLFVRKGREEGEEKNELKKKREQEPPVEKRLFEEEKRFPFLPTLFKLILPLFLLGLFVFFPFLSISWDILWGKRNLTMLEGNPLSFTPAKLESKAKEVEDHFLNARRKIGDFEWLFKWVGQEEKKREWSEKLVLGETIAAGAKEVGKAGVALEKLGVNILSAQEVKEEDITEGKIYLSAAGEKWGEAEAKLEEDPEVGEKAWAERLSRYRQLLKEAESWLEVLPQIIAIRDQKTYLLLLQNNMEIRPTGGFIGSFGLLTFEDGKLTNLKIEDIYTADGQLKGHIEPPEPIKRYLGKEHWFLRDSNWDPDFPETAQKTQWFLEKEIGVKTDGVLALDLNLAQNFLEVLGPLNLSDYQETVDSQSLFEKTQRYTETDFFPGSTQKRDFLGSLAQSLMEKIKSEDTKWLALGKAASRALKERHLLIYFNEPALEQNVLQNGWGGEVEDVPCQGDTDCLGDYLMSVEANLGVNKVNSLVKKEVTDQITFGEDGTVSHRLTLDYQNSSAPDTWLGGVYKNYLRIYVPSGVVLDELKIGGVATTSAEVATDSGKTTIGLYLEVPPKSEKEVMMIYHLPQKFLEKMKRYKLFFQKQAGIQIEPLTLEVSHPSLWQVGKVNLLSLTPKGYLKYNGSFQFDQEFEIEFLK